MRRGRTTWVRADGSPSENGEARTLAQWLELARIRGKRVLYTHVPNEATTRHPAVATILRALGTRRGMPDYLIFTPPNPVAGEGPKDGRLLAYAGVAIELKCATRPSTRGELDPKARRQLDTLAEFRAIGWFAAIALGAADAVRYLRYLGYEGPSLGPVHGEPKRR